MDAEAGSTVRLYTNPSILFLRRPYCSLSPLRLPHGLDLDPPCLIEGLPLPD